MNLEGTYTFAAARPAVWDALQNPEVLAKIMPGCEKLEQTGENSYEGVMKIRVGAVQGVFKGNVALSDLNAPESYKMVVKGNGPQGFVNGNGAITLSETEDGQTLMQYTGDANVGGRLASVGQRLIERSAKAIIKQSLDSLNKLIVAHQHAEETGTEPVEPPAPTHIEFAAGVAKNFIEDLDEEDQKNMILAGLATAGAILIIRGIISGFFDRFARNIAKRVVELAREEE